MKRRDWQDAYGEAPEAFRRRLLEALDGLEEKEMKHIRKGRRLATALIAAIIAILALTGGALAARNLGLFDYFRDESYKPLPGAEEVVETELGSAENGLVKLTVEEAVYDGRGALAQLRFAPKPGAQEYALRTPCLAETWGDSGRGDGLRELECDAKVRVVGESGEQIELIYWQGEAQEDGCIVLRGSGTSETPLGESVTLRVEPDVRAKRDDGTDESFAMDAIERPMKLSVPERYVELIPQNRLDGLEVLRAGLTLTPVRGYLTIEYACEPLPEGLMGIYIGLYDAAGHSLCISGGQGSPEVDGKYYWTYEVRTFDELPDALYLKPDIMPGKIECRLREADAPAVTMPQ